MSFFSEANKDADTVALDSGATGPRIGFLDAFEASREAQLRAGSVFGLEAAFREEEQEQTRRIRASGGQAPRALNDSEDGLTGGFTGGLNSRRYLDAARYFVTGEDRDGIAAVLADRETQLASIAEKNPTFKLKNYGEMFESVREKAQASERRWEGSRTSIGGDIGGFLGTTAGALDPRTDPFSFLTLPIGAFGATAGARIATQGFGQGAIESVNQFSGVTKNRDLLGLDSSVSRAALSVAGAAVGGAALQGLGEGAVALGRRWFRDAPTDPAPPVPEPPTPARTQGLDPDFTTNKREPELFRRLDLMEDFEAFKAAVAAERTPLGPSRRSQAVAEEDAAYFARTLDDWKGSRPWEVPPRTDTTLPQPVTTSRIDQPFDRAVSALETVDDVARRLDPETFRIYDKLSDTADRLRAWIDDLDTGRVSAANKSVEALEADIARVEAKLAKASAKNQPRLERELADLLGAREEQYSAVLGVDTPDQASVRKRLLDLDQQMRDLAPLVSRAYGLANNEWRSTGISAENLLILKDLQSRGSVSFAPETAPPSIARTAVVDEVPITASRPDATAGLPANADAADKIKAVVAAETKATEPALAEFRSTINKMLETEDGRLTFPNGKSVSLNDKITVPGLDGEGSRSITFRQYLDEVGQDEAALKAVGTCSVGRTS